MIDGANTPDPQDAQRGNGQVHPDTGTSLVPVSAGQLAEVEPHVTHLLPGERELLAECHQRRTYLTVCGQMLPVSELQSSLCEPGCERLFTYCQKCVHVAAKVNADAGLVWAPVAGR